MEPARGYIISGGIEGKKRLNLLAGVLHGHTQLLLQANGLVHGASFFDVGCGGGDVAVMAAKITGSNGMVTAIDFDKEIIALNKKDAEGKGISNILYNTQSAYDISYHNQFDVAYSRFLLSHLTEPQRVVNNMLKSVKPGGRIIIEDIDFSGHFCYPACTAFDEYVRLFTATAKQRGQNANIGPCLPSLFKAAGIAQINFDVIQPVFAKGDGKQMAVITMDKIKQAVVAEGLADAQTVNSIITDLEAFTNDPETIISPRIFRVWGVKD
ncbi:bifunctional 2-polyprenyl-6-hydroxyphenol methylase/3-demethylubiquinol 3-O-methyltransferase UbiG [Mucilaginibacter sp. AK015]|uniref:class I SAM-dependent methyltransferase n=1 Tax=Mucilaginibacter sp. AK015 TaxID=2723072 RepID=UPI00161430B9|nr:class I SAM-dependent methyltransferase [Mucilaginibacter sp. AK015]MBB5395885.1 ubiquinone/menaquinone biosynthesis C-methylase UbiE [Mucilaginibacter sp. AK015]